MLLRQLHTLYCVLALSGMEDHNLQFLSAEEHTNATPQALYTALNMH